ncbi:inositol 2-dehydrogenase [Paracoccus sp. N5]|uniref:inositol 2-dehydrogenase n=1 Tax=Paracoccus sp. N5 TaxID=1101189 RepID=UPI000362DD7F|nr:inositol 2-dehydrogenase [Paracoccus sp. N5]
MLNIAVLGCGRIGRMHADNIAAHPDAALAGVYDIHAPAADEVSQKLEVKNFASAEEIMASKEVDAVLIATSTATHADLIEAAVAVGKPILCEKPIDLSLDRVNLCAQRIAGSDVPIMLGFVRRFDPGHRAVRNAIAEGKLGDLRQVIISSRDPAIAPDAYIEASGGIFRDMTIHDFDMARFQTGEDIAEVFATGSRFVAPALMERCGDYDTISVILRTVSGKQVLINNSREAAYGHDQRVEAFGGAGMAISENRRNHMATVHTAAGTNLGAPLQHFFIDRYAEAFANEIGAFVTAVENKAQPEVGFEDGRQALIIAEAAFKSIAEGRAVKVEEIA